MMMYVYAWLYFLLRQHGSGCLDWEDGVSVAVVELFQYCTTV